MSRRRLAAWAAVALAAILFVAFNVLSQTVLRNSRIDLTENRLYTLSDGTRSVLADLPEPLTVRFFYSASLAGDLPTIRQYAQRVQEIKSTGSICAVSFTPQNTKRMSPVAVEAGADIVVVQSTVTTARHMSKSYKGLIFSELIDTLNVPVLVGNCVTYEVAQELMETGIDGILVGVGPGAACTTREVVGVGVPRLPPLSSAPPPGRITSGAPAATSP